MIRLAISCKCGFIVSGFGRDADTVAADYLAHPCLYVAGPPTASGAARCASSRAGRHLALVPDPAA